MIEFQYNKDNYYCYAANGKENWSGNCLWLPIDYDAPAEVTPESESNIFQGNNRQPS